MNSVLKIITKKFDSLISGSYEDMWEEPMWLKYFTRKLVFRDHKVLRVVSLSEVILLQAQSNYTIIYTDNGKILNCKTLKHWAEEINHDYFVRVHNSYLVNKMYIESINRSENMIRLTNDLAVPVTRRFKSWEFIFKDVHEL